MKLKTILFLIQESSGYGMAGGPLGGALTSNDSKLRPYPGSMDDVESWDGITEGNGWFCYRESNNWDVKRSGASVYITEGEPHKYWVRIKTHGLRKPNDTNESYRQRVRKHSDKVAKSWMSAARKIHNNPEINEVGNEIPISWNEAFKLALEDGKVKPFVAECGESQTKPTQSNKVSAISDPVNFTPRLEEQENPKISYSGIVLDNQYRQKLLKTFQNNIPEGWEILAHHMTICLGELPPDKKKDFGKHVNIMGTELGVSDKAVAVKVTNYPSNNKVPHITLAINRKGGARPVDSNSITDWKKLPQPIVLWGKVEEIPIKPKL